MMAKNFENLVKLSAAISKRVKARQPLYGAWWKKNYYSNCNLKTKDYTVTKKRIGSLTQLCDTNLLKQWIFNDFIRKENVCKHVSIFTWLSVSILKNLHIRICALVTFWKIDLFASDLSRDLVIQTCL